MKQYWAKTNRWWVAWHARTVIGNRYVNRLSMSSIRWFEASGSGSCVHSGNDQTVKEALSWLLSARRPSGEIAKVLGGGL